MLISMWVEETGFFNNGEFHHTLFRSDSHSDAGPGGVITSDSNHAIVATRVFNIIQSFAKAFYQFMVPLGTLHITAAQKQVRKIMFISSVFRATHTIR